MRVLLVLGIGVVMLSLGGCHQAGDDFDSKSRADQEKAFHGDPVKAKEMAAKMSKQYMQNNPQAGKPPQSSK